MKAYADLESRFARLSDIGGALAVLSWDRSAIMPAGGNEARAEQVATLQVLAHEILTDASIAGLLGEAEAEAGGLGLWQQANLREMRREWAHAAAVPADLVAASARACARCEMAWRAARPAADFAAVRPLLEEVLRLTRQIGEAKSAALGVGVYDALLDQFDPGSRQQRIDVLFAELEAELPGLLGEILEAQRRRPAASSLSGPFPIEAQRGLGVDLMAKLGFDFNHGRLDVSLHPFCGGVPDDVRITTRYNEADFAPALMGVLHETGHALYERGLPQTWRRQPVGQSRGMSVHESQSLLIEMQACRSRDFLRFAAPLMRAAFGGDGSEWDADNLHRLYTRVEPGFIRVDADEVTYPAHILLRYRMERALVAGDLTLADLPDAWNEGMQRLLGLTPPNDALGCLQDIHWFDGAWGYFPSYTLGALLAAQLFEAARQSDPEMLPGISVGDFAPLLSWLRAEVHGKGRLLDTEELVVQTTGSPLGTEAFIRHLRRRYLAAD